MWSAFCGMYLLSLPQCVASGQKSLGTHQGNHLSSAWGRHWVCFSTQENWACSKERPWRGSHQLGRSWSKFSTWKGSLNKSKCCRRYELLQLNSIKITIFLICKFKRKSYFLHHFLTFGANLKVYFLISVYVHLCLLWAQSVAVLYTEHNSHSKQVREKETFFSETRQCSTWNNLSNML